MLEHSIRESVSVELAAGLGFVKHTYGILIINGMPGDMKKTLIGVQLEPPISVHRVGRLKLVLHAEGNELMVKVPVAGRSRYGCGVFIVATQIVGVGHVGAQVFVKGVRYTGPGRVLDIIPKIGSAGLCGRTRSVIGFEVFSGKVKSPMFGGVPMVVQDVGTFKIWTFSSAGHPLPLFVR